MHNVTFLWCFSFFLFLECFLDLLRESKNNHHHKKKTTLKEFMDISIMHLVDSKNNSAKESQMYGRL